MYNAIGQCTGVKLAGETDAAEEEKPKGSLVNRMIDTLSGIFLPIMGAMAAAGLLKAFLIMFSTLGWMSSSGSTYQVLYSLGDGMFYFMPIFLAYSAAAKFKCNPWIAMTVAAGLCYPNLAAIENPNVFGIPFVLITYTSSVIPIVVATWFQSKLEPQVKKIIPAVVSGIFTPAIVALVTFHATLFMMRPSKQSVWVYCPFCGAKTRTKIYADSTILRFPLYCPKCKKEYAVNIIQRKIYLACH